MSVKISRAKPAKLRLTLPIVDASSARSVKSQDRKGSLMCANCDMPAERARSLGWDSVSAVVVLSGLSPDERAGVEEFEGEGAKGR